MYFIFQISHNAQALDIILGSEDRVIGDPDRKDTTVQNLSIMEKARDFVQDNSETTLTDMCTKFQQSLSYTNYDICRILEATDGQCNNKLWHSIRKGMLTASNFGKASHYIDIDKDPPSSFVKSIMGKSRIDEQHLPQPLKWGRRKEPVARLLYKRLFKRNHISLQVKEQGILLSEINPCIGCSVDGIVTCRCRPKHPDRIIEIKCPYSSRDKMPKEAAIERKICYNDENCRWEVTSDCPYYAQVQGQLGLCCLQECDLVIYTKSGIHVSTAVFDSSFFSEMLKKVLLFHEKYIVPTILHKVLSE